MRNECIECTKTAIEITQARALALLLRTDLSSQKKSKKKVSDSAEALVYSFVSFRAFDKSRTLVMVINVVCFVFGVCVCMCAKIVVCALRAYLLNFYCVVFGYSYCCVFLS